MFEKKNWLAAFAVSVALIVGLMCAGCKNSVDGDVGVSSRNSGKYPVPNIGDVVLKDGSTIRPADIDDTNKSEVKDNAVAIVFWTNPNTGKYLGMGLEISSEMYWADDELNTSNTKLLILEEDSAVEEVKNAAGSLSIKNEFQPTDNLFPKWVEYGEKCYENNIVTENLFSTHPEKFRVFSYANNYGETRFPSTEYENDWFLPSTAALYKIAGAQVIIDETLRKLDKDPIRGNDRSPKIYWSSVSDFGRPGRRISVCLNPDSPNELFWNGNGLWNGTGRRRPHTTDDISSAQGASCYVIAVRVFQY